ncbi:aminoglycoside N(3)-acetyltransferase [Paenibacillus eucommiae]|uniref:Aminoglycoside N(3)-acetyltransferase n=1 Tax=Paenibacillus eucommiae TaxID=1355755 RepID=A0ABS4IT30_9BACL|nr:AAC(3) family N-acetyltransferase [Paenibacillus eucommiae]MBP1989759.1 aminoglycoside 3-N-acetyltransferase [Paenibacillus eucommiae]
MKINESEYPLTPSLLVQELTNLGIARGMNLFVHSSLKSLNRWIVGGAQTVIISLEEAIGEEGTLIMPAQSVDLSDPACWENPPVPEDWWDIIRTEMPVFDRDLTPTSGMGVVAECFRKQNGTLRSDHPQVSFAARGPKAQFITDPHPLANGLGESSPLARIFDCNSWVLLFGVDHSNSTSLHLSEYRANYPGKKQVEFGAPILMNGRREWVTFRDLDYDSNDFQLIGRDFERETNNVKIGKIGDATLRLMPQRQLVDFGVQWIENNRGT